MLSRRRRRERWVSEHCPRRGQEGADGGEDDDGDLSQWYVTFPSFRGWVCERMRHGTDQVVVTGRRFISPATQRSTSPAPAGTPSPPMMSTRASARGGTRRLRRCCSSSSSSISIINTSSSVTGKQRRTPTMSAMVVMAGEVKPLLDWRRDTPKGCVVARD